MIQAPPPNEVHYTVRLLADACPGARIVRTRQSVAAAGLLAELRAATTLAAGPSSKAHTRALMAVAVAAAGRIGIDAEYFHPRRDIRAVARWLMQADAADDTAAYRVFTFREAYFKAIGQMPAAALLRDVALQTTPRFELSPEGLSVLQEVVADDFALTLVWEGGGTPVRHELPEQPEGRLQHEPRVHP